MPDVIETTVYRLDELPDAAKDMARAWYREGGLQRNAVAPRRRLEHAKTLGHHFLADAVAGNHGDLQCLAHGYPG